MDITTEQIEFWMSLRKQGDFTELIGEYNGIRPIRLSDISKAFANRKAPEHVVVALSNFYEEKKKVRKKV